MKMTLLEMVQNILSSMDSDDVNDITDTVESLQVAEVVKESYFSLIAERDWPFLRGLFTLTALADTARPTTMRMPTNVNKVAWIKYNKKDVEYKDPQEFQYLLDTRVETTGVVDSNGFILNADPQYWTTFDDDYVVFDGYDSAVDSTLVSAKSNAYGVTIPTWSATNAFVPTMPDKFFPTLLAEAKATCFLNMKQQANPREEKRAHNGRSRMQNEAWRANAGESKYNDRVNYGRRGSRSSTQGRKNKYTV